LGGSSGTKIALTLYVGAPNSTSDETRQEHVATLRLIHAAFAP
jgi:hypothetical protein